MSATASGKIFAADDWGFSPAVNKGILLLAERGWLRSVSCAANAPHLLHGIEELRRYNKNGVEVSLHFCLTYGRPLKARPSLTQASGEFLPHKRLMLAGLRGRLSAEDIKKEFLAQLAAVRAAGLRVESLDGHHHVHLLPFVASALQPLLKSEGIHRVRALSDPQHLFSYAQTAYYKYFVHQPDAAALEPCNYLRPAHLRSRQHLLRKIAGLGERALLVHPALYNDFGESHMTDGLTDYRIFELERVVKFLE